MPDDDSNKAEKTVPWDRFQTVVTAKQELERQLAEAKAEAARYQEAAATSDTLAAQLRDTKKSLETAQASHARELALARAGLDEEGAAVADALHARLPEKDRPTLDAWLSQLKRDPSKAPKALANYLSTAAEPGEPEGGEAPKGAPPEPKGEAHKGSPPRDPGGRDPKRPQPLDPEAIDQMSAAELKALKEKHGSLNAALRAGRGASGA